MPINTSEKAETHFVVLVTVKEVTKVDRGAEATKRERDVVHVVSTAQSESAAIQRAIAQLALLDTEAEV